jgi:hypothetical protein
VGSVFGQLKAAELGLSGEEKTFAVSNVASMYA